MFKELMPILADRKVKMTLEAKDGTLLLYIEPVKKSDSESDALAAPFVVRSTPEELDAGLDHVLVQWVATRQQVCNSLQAALDASSAQMKAAADAGKKEAQDKAAKAKRPVAGKNVPPVKPRAAAVAPAPTLALEAAASQDVAPAAAQNAMATDAAPPSQAGEAAPATPTASAVAVVLAGDTSSLF